MINNYFLVSAKEEIFLTCAKSAAFINNLDFNGVALGGLGIGEGRERMATSIKASLSEISLEKPRYLMGVGSPEDLIDAIELGIDCFDSRFPTMNSRHGGIFTSSGKIDIGKVAFKDDERPLDENCTCLVCRKYSRAFLHHLYRTFEPIRDRYGNIHNLHFLQQLMKEARLAIQENRFASFKKEFFSRYKLNENKKTVFTYN